MNTSSSTSASKIGPRAKCDQVVYEAIAKAAEIIVRGRCHIPESGHEDASVPSKSSNRSNPPRSLGTGGRNSASASVSRFHLEVEEVDSVRSILQMWKKSLHVPLRLDVYYEYSTPNTNDSQQTTTRKDLLERWCIDYLPTNHSSTTSKPTYQQHDETIVQLRQVVKRVIIFLRVLNSLTRMMPAYKLHHALMEERNDYFNNRRRLEGGGPGLTGGYYPSMQHKQQLQQQHSNDMKEKEEIGGSIKYSFYVSSDTSSPQHHLNDVTHTLFSSTTNSPFARHDLNPIATPYGILHLTALYDETLNMERVMTDRARRLLEWNHYVGNGNGNGMVTMPRAIPIQREENGHQQQHQHQQQPQTQDFGNASPHTYHANDIHQHQQQRKHELPQPMSLPNPSLADASKPTNVVSEHLIQNYARSPDDIDHGLHLRHRLGSDPGAKRQLSGLSLALMNEQSQQIDNVPSSPSSPQIPPAASSEEAASWKQRVALHHPPPSFDNQQNLLQAASASPKFMQMQQPSTQYGYGYNNGNKVKQSAGPSPDGVMGIVVGRSGANSPSPIMTLVNTPPQPFFLGSLPRNIGGGIANNSTDPSRGRAAGDDHINDGGGGGGTESSQNNGQHVKALISPPFHNPIALQQVPSSDASHASGGTTTQQLAPVQQQQHQQQLPQYAQSMAGTMSQAVRNSVATTDTLLLPPLTSMDGLAFSPFKLPTGQVTGGGNSTSANAGPEFSSISLGMGSATAFGHYEDGIPLALGVAGTVSNGGGGFASGSEHFLRNNSGHDPLKNEDGDDDADDDMPFAVDMDDPTNCTSILGGGGDASVGNSSKMSKYNNSGMDLNMGSSVSSQVVTSFAHRCATAGRLKLFSSEVNQLNDGVAGAGTGGVTSDMSTPSPPAYESNITEPPAPADKRDRDGGNESASVSNLTDQLADFKSFSDSIIMSGLIPPQRSGTPIQRKSVTLATS